MTLNTREWNLLVATVLVILLGSTWMLGGDKLQEWRELRETRETLSAQKGRHEARIGRKEDLLRQLDLVKLVLPQHRTSQDLKSEFMQRIQSLADKSLLTVEKLDSDNEKSVGGRGLYKMAVRVNWKGSLKELVPFLYDVQSQGVVMDVRDISVKSDSSGMLKGSLAVDFAYSRGEGASAPAPAPAPAAVPIPAAVRIPSPAPAVAAADVEKPAPQPSPLADVWVKAPDAPAPPPEGSATNAPPVLVGTPQRVEPPAPLAQPPSTNALPGQPVVSPTPSPFLVPAPPPAPVVPPPTPVPPAAPIPNPGTLQ